MKKIIISFFTALIFSSFSYADPVYSWVSEDGTTVFSEKKPPANIEYREVEVSKPTVVDVPQQASKIANPNTENQNVEIDQSKLSKLENSPQAKQQNETLQKEFNRYPITITSPSEGQGIFSKEDVIEVKTNPVLSKDDKPQFIIDGDIVPAKYADGKWTIARPIPGEHKLSVGGQTKDGKNINSTNNVSFNVFTGWITQSKNTGNITKKS